MAPCNVHNRVFGYRWLGNILSAHDCDCTMNLTIAAQFTYLVGDDLSMADGYSKYGEFITRLLRYSSN
jgi:hypothetical protein